MNLNITIKESYDRCQFNQLVLKLLQESLIYSAIPMLQPVSNTVPTKRQFLSLADFPRSRLCEDLLYPTVCSTYCDIAPPSVSWNKVNASFNYETLIATFFVLYFSACLVNNVNNMISMRN